MTTRTLMRKSGTFSLEEAARIRRAIETGGSAQCPSCRTPISRMVGDNGRGDVWLLQCRVCGRSLVLRDDPAHSPPRKGEDRATVIAPR
jgi:hypothetical protein